MHHVEQRKREDSITTDDPCTTAIVSSIEFVIDCDKLQMFYASKTSASEIVLLGIHVSESQPMTQKKRA